MRPGQLTPENCENMSVLIAQSYASMRPGQLTPENNAAMSAHPFQWLASMRPGQLTPENKPDFRAGAGPEAPLQ